MTSADPRVTNPIVVDTLLHFPPKYGYSGQDCYQATLLLKFDVLPKIPCCFNLFTLNVSRGIVLIETQRRDDVSYLALQAEPPTLGPYQPTSA